MEDKNLKLLLETILDRKGEDVVYIDVQDSNPLACYFIIASANSNRQALAIAQAIKDTCEINHITLRHVEGKNASDWVLIDANDYIIHIFTKEARIHYGLEKLWAHLKITKVE